MTIKTDPFTRTPGLAGRAYIDSGIADTIIEYLNDDFCEKHVFKITGVRGSGKSVEYSKVIQTMKKEKEWLVYSLAATGEAIRTLISKLSMESFIDSNQTTISINQNTQANGNLFVANIGGEIGIEKSISKNDHYYSQEATLLKMVEKANKKGFRILIGIDDISKTSEMVHLLSMVAAMMLEGCNIYLIVTGLAENIEDFTSEKSLSFFKRADTFETKALNKYDIASQYERFLGIDAKCARDLELESLGYAYAYQVLGSLYFNKAPEDDLKSVLLDYEKILFRDSYDLIWKSLSESEKDLMRAMLKSTTFKTAHIKKQMNKANNYSALRGRLINKHIVDADTYGYLKFKLPHFDRFVEIWGDD